MTVKEVRKALVGRTIVGYVANAFRDGDLHNSITYDPVLVLDDGTRLRFRVHETQIGEYGIDPIIHEPST